MNYKAYLKIFYILIVAWVIVHSCNIFIIFQETGTIDFSPLKIWGPWAITAIFLFIQQLIRDKFKKRK
ncbi:hypothetical protein [Limibacterium fermenti]|jgi:hypothetical protein|uniref:hypothetical protein n=1 Tax=Limibacterium fermenti TaxID=3229863 RepID=UPI000E9E1F14|nr:hypothetical protein [Porphyromonadaceae bacterium]HBX46355.1 hypothetical protein [Porphyromonadaceae bacterium]